jgi:hypothetical protein
MNIHVGCMVTGCPSVYHGDETPSPNGVRYVCSHHTDEELRAAGILKTERTDKEVRFQEGSFDKSIRRKTSNRQPYRPTADSPEFPKSNLTDFIEESAIMAVEPAKEGGENHAESI